MLTRKTKAPCGTRSKYVTGCRCTSCRNANRVYANRRNERASKLAASLPRGETTKAPQEWTHPDGTKKVRMYKRACQGPGGQGCKFKAHLRKDSKGYMCGRCRGHLLSDLERVPAEGVQKRILELSAMGVGLRTVSDVAHLSRASLRKVKSGLAKRVLPETARAVMEVGTDIVNDTTLVRAQPSWLLVSEMVNKGLDLYEIAERLGQHRGILLLRYDWISAKKELRIKKAYKIFTEELAIPVPLLETCPDCGLSHVPEARFKMIARMLPCSARDVTDAYPCIYPRSENNSRDNRRIFRDLHILGAIALNGLWNFPTTKETENARRHEASDSDYTERERAKETIREDGVPDPGAGSW